MSIIERYSPLNLAYKIIVVTNASSPVGVIVSNTLLKANALVLGVDNKPKDDTLSASTYSHFQFWKCQLTDDSAVDDIIAYATKVFKTDRINGMVNLTNADDDADTLAAHEKLAVRCAKTMEGGIDGGSVVNTVIQAANIDAQASHAVDQLLKTNKQVSSEVSKNKVRCNIVAEGDKANAKPYEPYTEAQDHFNFLLKPHDDQYRPKVREITDDIRAMFAFSNVILYLISGMSEGKDGIVLNRQGQLVQS